MTKSPTAGPNPSGAIADKLRAVAFTATTNADGDLAGIHIDIAPGLPMSAPHRGRPRVRPARRSDGTPASDVMPIPAALLPDS